MSTKKKTTKKPLAKQLAARRKFALAAKARAKAAKRPAHKNAKSLAQRVRARHLRALAASERQLAKRKAAKKRNSKTIIKAKRVTVFNANPKQRLPRKPNITSAFDLDYIGNADSAERDGVKGRRLARKFYPRQIGHKTTSPTKTTLLDLTTGGVWKKRKKNPKRRNSLLHETQITECKINKLTGAKVCKTLNGNRRPAKCRNAPEFSSTTPIEVSRHYRSGGPGYATKREKIIKLGQRDLFAPEASIEDLLGYLRKKNPTAINLVKRKLGAKRFATASPSVLKRELKAVLTAELKKRQSKKAAKPRRNPNATAQAKEQFKEFHGYTPSKSVNVYIPESAPTEGLSTLGEFYQFTFEGGGNVKPAVKVWLLRDLKGRLHLGGTQAGAVLTNEPAGYVGTIKKIEYIAAKPHLNEPNKIIWFHRAGEEGGAQPKLFSDGKGGLLIKGGDYYITPEGIRN